MVEVDRPDRKARRLQGKSDPVVAGAARAALSTCVHGVAKHRDGKVDALRNLRVAHRCDNAHRADVLRRIRILIVTAPVPLREQLRGHAAAHLIRACTALRPDTSGRPPGTPRHVYARTGEGRCGYCARLTVRSADGPQ